MQILGITLAVTVAILWGLADSIATVSARRQAIFMTTLISQISGFIALSFLAIFGRGIGPAVTVAMPSQGLFLSALTGMCAAVGYFSLYQAMEKGPLAITSPLSSTSALVTLAISMVLLHEQLTFLEGLAIVAVIVGVMLASTRYEDLLNLFKQQSLTLFASSGVRWAYGAVVAFGVMDFTIGAMSPRYGWFVPVFWTRVFSVMVFTTIFLWQWYHKVRYKKILLSFASVASYASFKGIHKRYIEKREKNARILQTSSYGIRFAILAGILENAAVLVFSMATSIIQPGEAAAIASNYSVVAILFGIIVFRERITLSQCLAIICVLCGITVLALIHQ